MEPVIHKEMSYYELYLRRHLRDTGNSLSSDHEFITTRADAAAEEYERQRLDGASVFQAQELAMSILMEGID